MNNDKQNNDSTGEILLNLMGTGGYLDENLGHEIINLFRDDSGVNNIYVLPYGTFDAIHKDKIDVILLAQRVGDDCIEVLAKAWQLKQVVDLSMDAESQTRQQNDFCSSISYGGTPLPQIFSGNRTNDEKHGLVFVSFQAGEVRRTSRRICITDKEDKADGKNIIFIPGINFPKSSPKGYYGKDDPEKAAAYQALEALIGNEELWEEENGTEKVDIRETTSAVNSFNFLRLIRKEDDELSFSNLFAHYFKMSGKLCGSFVREVLGIADAKDDFQVDREYRHIDLLLTDDKYVIVIENKIKSKINGLKYDINGKIVHSQLEDYMKIADGMAKGRTVRCFIISPDYNQIKLDAFPDGRNYEIRPYSRILDFLEHFFIPQNIPDAYYADFLKAMKKHVSNGTLHYEMHERFLEAIRYKGVWHKD